MPRRKQNRPMRVGEEAGSLTLGEMEPGSIESTPDNTDILINKGDDDRKKRSRSESSSDSSPPPPPPSSSAATLSTFAPLDLSIKKSPFSSSRQTPSPVSLRISTGTPPNQTINGSANHAPITQPQLSSVTTPSKGGKGLMKVSSGGNRGSGGRQNPWQTQWMNRSSEQTRDVFTCVWCKESFKSLQDMTLHMKKSPRCGMAGMQQAAAATASLSSSLSSSSQSSSSHHPVPSSPLLSHHLPAHHPHLSSSAPSGANGSIASKGTGGGRNAASASSGATNSNSSSKSEPMSSAVLAKNNVALPRKLVRGQDVWLGRGAEQTRQILKCMWCAQSFKSLDEMTRHMRITQHYTNIISQEQIISWRTPEDKVAQAQVNAVLTCKVCDEAFGSLKELSYHMVKNAHYKEHILRSITEGGHGRRRQTRERRKKSLPVRKLLELERMEIVPPSDPSTKVSASSSTKSTSEKVSVASSRSRDSDIPSNTNKDQRGSSTSTPSLSSSSSITCDECSEQVESRHFISHLKECIKQQLTSGHLQGGTDSLTRSPKSIPRSPDSVGTSGHPSGPPSRCQSESPSSITEAGVNTHPNRPHLKKEEQGESGCSGSELDDDVDDDGQEEDESRKRRMKGEKDGRSETSPKRSPTQEPSTAPATQSSSSSACLSALENLIEKSFDTKPSVSNTSSHRLDKAHRHHQSSSGRHHHRHSKSSKLPASSSALSNVEKWMTLAKERDGPGPYSGPNNMWSPSISSSSNSSWNNGGGSDEEGMAEKVGSNLVMNLKGRGNHHEVDDLRSPSSSASADSRPGSSAIQVKRSRSPVGKKSFEMRKKLKKGEGEERRERSTPISKMDSEEERREEIEELKRSGLKAESPVSANKNTSSESLSALEKLIEKSFDSKKKNTPTGFLQRLGIDEEVCPPWQPGLLAAALPFGHPFQPWLIPKLSVPQDSRSSSSSPAKTNKNGSICSSPPAT